MATSFASSNYSNFPFTPLEIPGCAVWFDAADSNTYSGSGTATFQWRSKGIYSLTATSNAGPAPTAATCNGYPSIYFPAATTQLLTGTIPSLGATGTTWFGVGYNTCNPQPADAAVLIASLSPEKSIRWSVAGNYQVYTIEGSPIGSTNATSNGVRGFIENSNTSNFSVYQNGSLNTSLSIPSYTGGTNVQFSMGQWNTSGLIGWINEVIIYNSALTLSQYQQVEGYLAWKWGYNSQLPSTHPNYTKAPATAGQITYFGQTVNLTLTKTIPVRVQNISFWKVFNPAALPNCVGWFDGADPLGTGVAPTAGAALTTWYDKSGQANNAVSVGSNPTYSNGYVNFRGSNTLAFTTPNALVASNSFSIFVVEQRSNVQTATNYTYWLAGSTTSQNTDLQFGYRNSNDVTLGFFNNDVDFSSVPNPTANEPFRLWDGIWDGTNQYIYLNGSNAAQRAQSGNLTSWSNGSIGFYGASATFYSGNIGEIIFYKPALNATYRQQVEGYLAYKWGVQSNLPSTHPVASNESAILYSNIVIPMSKTIFMSGTNRWLPTKISGLGLWLDAADTSTIVQSGGSVSQWNDKSGNGINCTISGTPTLLTSSLNGLNGIQFYNTTGSNSNAWTSPSFAISSTNSISAFVVGNSTPVNPGNIYFISTGLSAPSTPNDNLSMVINTSTAAYRLYVNGATFSSTAFTNTNGVTNLYEVTYNNATETPYVNGTAYVTASGSGTGLASSQYIGSYTGTGGANLKEYEILLFNVSLTTIQRQQVEGYLAWKWGLRTSLPANHPYKIIPVS